MFTNDPLKAAMISAMLPLTTACEIVPRILFDAERGPLAGHVLLDLLEENGAGPQEAQVIAGIGDSAGLLAMHVQAAAASRGLGYHVALARETSAEVIGAERLEGADVVVADTGASDAHQIGELVQRLRGAGANVLAVAVLGWPGYVRPADADATGELPLYVAIEKETCVKEPA
ncbi:hypothetical protein ACFPGO_02350 [Arcanobacterium canis]|uniref:Orotate phosphoribosyltransferase n=1 Tax=Arcanobacterium canis TaxID=999183 RepID=A0ABY8G298_9ACTO|nr:hypothetical protein [Arcanobacterium canis]WFM83189.1 hypothetical protein P7079_07300 [Arcanobacterium canis]